MPLQESSLNSVSFWNQETNKNVLPTSELLGLLCEWDILIAFVFFKKQVLQYWFGFAFLQFCICVQTKLIASFGT